MAEAGEESRGERRLRILHATPFVPFPPDSGGKLVPFHHAVGLAKRGHVVTLVAPLRRAGDGENFARLPRAIRKLPVETANRGIVSTAIRFLFRNESFRVARHTFPAVERAVRRAVGDFDPDVILLDSLFSAYLIPAIRSESPAIPIVLVEHNIESSLFRRYARKLSPPLRWIAAVETARITWMEREFAAASDTVVTLSGADRSGLCAICPSTDPIILPPGTTIRPGTNIPPPTRRNGILFLGNYRWEPNRDAARWLVREIFPRIRSTAPGTTLTLAGDDPTGAMADLHAPSRGVDVRGRVADPGETVREHAVVLVPMRLGGGVRLKILEAFANERPVVTTSLGCEGLPVEDGVHLLIADDAIRFAKSVTSVLRDRAGGFALAAAGRELVESRFGWDRIVGRLDEILAKAIARCG